MFKAVSILMTAAMLASPATPKYSQGNIGTDIYAIQSRLASLGYFNIKITGIYGPVLENAFKQFQISNDLPVTGIVTDEELEYLFSSKAQPKLKSSRNIPKASALINESYANIKDSIDAQSFELNFVTLNKTATFTISEKSGYFEGSLSKIDTSKLNVGLHYPVIATIDNAKYPASIDYRDGKANLHFKDSISFLGIPDSEHQYNINALLGL